MSAPRHRKGEPFTEAHLLDGEVLTVSGHIRRGEYLIIPMSDGYRYMEQFGRYRMSRTMRSYSLTKVRATVDALNRQIEKGNR